MTDNRAKLANVMSIRQQQVGKTARHAHTPRTDRARADLAIVPRVRKADPSARQYRTSGDTPVGARAGIPALANMQDGRIFSDRQLERLGIVHPRSNHRTLLDAMHRLRNSLYSINPAGNFSVLVSSVVPDGGGSFVALNLAATIAFDKAKSALLVDANVRSPVLHKLVHMVGNEDVHGLLDYLERDELGVEQIVSPSGIPRMRVIPAGTVRETGGDPFGSARYRQLMSDIQQRYDDRFVIVDGPAMSEGTDARRLSEICDYTLLVVPYAGVTPRKLDAIVQQVDERRLAGIVLNDQPV